MFAIIDTETSGGKFNEERIIEIGILIFDGNDIIKTFQSLINPKKKVDYFVQTKMYTKYCDYLVVFQDARSEDRGIENLLSAMKKLDKKAIIIA